jgi:hypothetical protein
MMMDEEKHLHDEWLRKRHKTWQWTLVVAALLGAAVLYLVQYKQQNALLQARADR